MSGAPLQLPYLIEYISHIQWFSEESKHTMNLDATAYLKVQAESVRSSTYSFTQCNIMAHFQASLVRIRLYHGGPRFYDFQRPL